MSKNSSKLEKNLKGRHIQMMAIGGAIGTGLFLGSGKSIHLTGPSILLSYLITGIACFFIMRALGELLLSDLRHSSFVGSIRAYFGERWAFITAWTYWFCWASIAMADLTAVGIYVQYWLPGTPQWVPGFVALLLIFGVNILTVKLFGELEFWFALIKVVAIVALIVVGVVLIALRYEVSTKGVVSLSNLWRDGFFPNGTMGYLLSFQMVVFSFVGIEMVGITVAEMQNPERALKLSINRLPIRILLFYIGALVVIMSITPWKAINPALSPFVSVFSIIGVSGAAGIVNFVVLTSAASACNSGVYSTGRILYNMGRREEAPKLFSKVSARNIPSRSLLFSCIVIFISIILNYIIPSTVFTLVTSVSTCCFLFVWGMIVACHMRYRKLLAQNKLKSGVKAVPSFKMPFYPFSSWLVLVFLAFVAVILVLAKDTRLAMFIVPFWILFLAFMFRLKKRLTLKKDEKSPLVIAQEE
jgi:D-serine/D-alanine/glycine transporter